MSKWNRGFKPEPVPWCNSGYYLQNRPSFTLDLLSFWMLLPQEASSMFLEQSNQTNFCYAGNLRYSICVLLPEGKVHIFLILLVLTIFWLLMKQSGQEPQLLLKQLLNGVWKYLVTRTILLHSELAGIFYIIIVDAPCSGEGMFRGETAVRECPSETQFIAQKAEEDIDGCLAALKENGYWFTVPVH